MKKRMWIMLVLVLTVVIAIGCSVNDDSNKNDGKTNDENVEKNNNDSGASGEVDLQQQMVWSVYSTGAGTYADMAAIAEAFTKAYSSNIRLLPSDTGVGRMAPLKDGKADIGRVGEEYIYSFEGTLDFTTKDWGPQDVRMVWGPIEDSSIGLAVAKSSGIKTPADLKGKKIANILSNPSVKNKMDAYLAYGDLTYDDVKTVDLTYNDQVEAFKGGQIDAVLFNPFGAAMFELASSIDFEFINLDLDDNKAWDRVADIAPSVLPGTIQDGAGMDDGEVVNAIVYSVPIVAYADKDIDFIYNFVKALDEEFNNYKDVTSVLHNHDINKILQEPVVVPFHDGVVKYLKEKDLWTDQAEEKNNELIEKQEKLKEGWSSMDLNSSEQDLINAWESWRASNLD